MEATLTELRRETKKVMRTVERGEPVILTEHGEPRAKIVPLRKIDREALCRALIDLGPIDLPPRK